MTKPTREAAQMTDLELASRYGKSSLERFWINGKIGVPHPFTIGSRHVAHALDHHNGIPDERTLRAVKCAHKGCQLKYSEHETALTVLCSVKPTESSSADIELSEFLQSIATLAEADGFAGFVLVDGFSKQGAAA